jgi:hypothetical protein
MVHNIVTFPFIDVSIFNKNYRYMLINMAV